MDPVFANYNVGATASMVRLPRRDKFRTPNEVLPAVNAVAQSNFRQLQLIR
jgi:hypothetical protein